MAIYSAPEMDVFPDRGCFLNMLYLGLLYVKEKQGNQSWFPQTEGVGLLLTIEIHRKSKGAIPLHLSFFAWAMVILVPVGLTQHLFQFPPRLPSCAIKAGKLETQFLRLPCS